MKNNAIQIKVKQRLNKISSQDYDNIECWQISEAFNKASLEWVRKQIIGLNLYQTGDEGSKNLIDDIQHLIKNQELSFSSYTSEIETQVLPEDYLYFKRITVYAKTASCVTPKMMIAYQAQEADIAVLLEDHNTEPDFEWGETFFTIANNRIKVFTKGKFIISKVILTYYKKPRPIGIVGCVDINTGATITVESETDFKDDVAEIVIDQAISILASSIESMNIYQITDNNVKTNT